jgi:DNA-binding response OmpR family regulator
VTSYWSGAYKAELLWASGPPEATGLRCSEIRSEGSYRLTITSSTWHWQALAASLRGKINAVDHTVIAAQPPEGRVLVVDDEPDIRSTLARFLDLLGYESRGASTGREALEMLGSDWFDVAVVDLRLPDIDGVEVMRRADEVRPETAIVFLTGYATIDSAIAAVNGRAAGYLRKPVSVHAIAEAVARAMARPQHPDRSDARRRKSTIRVGPLTLNTERRRVIVTDGLGPRTVALTSCEAALLACLMQSPGAVISHRELACNTLSYEVDDFEAPGLIRPHICRLRKKLEPRPAFPQFVRTVPGRGYLLGV